MESKQHEHQHICCSFLCPLSPMGTMQYSPDECYPRSRFEMQLRNTELGKYSTFRAGRKQVCLHGGHYLIPQGYRLRNNTVLGKEQRVLRKVVETEKVRRKVLQQYGSVTSSIIQWHKNWQNLLSVVTWKIGNAANKLSNLTEEITRQHGKGVSLLILNAYGKVEVYRCIYKCIYIRSMNLI